MVCWNTSQNGAQQKHTLNKIDPFIYYKGTNKKKSQNWILQIYHVYLYINLRQALMRILRMEVPASLRN